MEMWVVLSIVAALLFAFCLFVDNYITDVFFKIKNPLSQKVFYGPAFLGIALLIGIFGDIELLSIKNIICLVLAGIISGMSLIPYILALKRDNSTDISLIEQLSPIFYLLLGWLLLGDEIHGMQIIAFFIVLMAPLITVFSGYKRGKNSRIKTAGLMLLKVSIHALACVMIVKYGSDCSLATMLFYVSIGKGLGDSILALIIKSWRKDFKRAAKKNKLKIYIVMGIDSILWTAADFAYYMALMIAPAVAMASATTKTLQPLLVFVLGIILTILWPNFGREKINKRTVMTHLIATILAMIGIFLMQIS